MKESIIEHISYSAFAQYKTCPFAFKLKYVDRIKTPGNIFSIFGSAMHNTLEDFLKRESYTNDEIVEALEKNFSEILEEKSKTEYDNALRPRQITEEDLETFLNQGKNIIPQVVPKLKEYFGEFEVIETEEDLYELLETGEFFNNEENNLFLKGFVDLIIKIDDKYHIIDYKTATWGWDKYKKSDKMKAYQLVLYKHFWCKKHGIDPNNVETYFVLLKRTPKQNNVEVFRVTSGKIKTKNALSMLDETLGSIFKKMFFKDRRGCTWCDFRHTKHCP